MDMGTHAAAVAWSAGARAARAGGRSTARHFGVVYRDTSKSLVSVYLRVESVALTSKDFLLLLGERREREWRGSKARGLFIHDLTHART